MLKITNVQVLDKTLPIGNRTYAVGRITGLDGSPEDITAELKALTYRADVTKERITNVECTGLAENMGALYVFLEVMKGSEDDKNVDMRMIDTFDDFLSPFAFKEDILEQFKGHYFGRRADDAQVKWFDMLVEDEDAEAGSSTIKVFYNIEEIAYIVSDVEKLVEFFVPNRIAELQTDVPIKMIFAESLTKGIDLYNQINVYEKADDIAAIISGIMAFNLDGELTPLNMAAVEKLFDRAKEKILVGGKKAEK